MTIVNAFKQFIKKLTGVVPIGNNIAEIISDGASKVSAQSAFVKYEDASNESFVLKSSTASSKKQFRVTVTDDGILAAAEIV